MEDSLYVLELFLYLGGLEFLAATDGELAEEVAELELPGDKTFSLQGFLTGEEGHCLRSTELRGLSLGELAGPCVADCDLDFTVVLLTTLSLQATLTSVSLTSVSTVGTTLSLDLDT